MSRSRKASGNTTGSGDPLWIVNWIDADGDDRQTALRAKTRMAALYEFFRLHPDGATHVHTAVSDTAAERKALTSGAERRPGAEEAQLGAAAPPQPELDIAARNLEHRKRRTGG